MNWLYRLAASLGKILYYSTILLAAMSVIVGVVFVDLFWVTVAVWFFYIF